MFHFGKFVAFIFLNIVLCRAVTPQFKGVVPCLDDDDCKYYNNATCIQPSCMCNGTTFCIETVDTVVTKIGENCTRTQECNIDHSECQNNKCVCEKGYVETANGRKCLIISEGIGGACDDSVQCYSKTNHSVCRNNKCICEGMHEINKTCYQNVELGEACQVDAECSLNKFSSCRNSTCTCNDGFASSLNNTACLQVAEGNNSACVDSPQCTTTLGHYSHCVDGSCKCKELYHYKDKINKCILDKLFGDKCVIHSDCHDPFLEKESRLECIVGECKCRSFYTEINGICIDNSSCTKISISLSLFVFIFILKMIL